MSNESGLNLVPLLGPPTKMTALVAPACVLDALRVGIRRLIVVALEGIDAGREYFCSQVVGNVTWLNGNFYIAQCGQFSPLCRLNMSTTHKIDLSSPCAGPNSGCGFRLVFR